VALKDITLGQYFPGNSPIHRLDPRAKLVALILYIVALFMAKWFVTYAVMLAVLVVVTALSTVKPKALLRGMRPVLILLIFTGVLNMFYTPGRELVSFWIFTFPRAMVPSSRK
jgi:energy-coupling factor transport system permease protein